MSLCLTIAGVIANWTGVETVVAVAPVPPATWTLGGFPPRALIWVANDELFPCRVAIGNPERSYLALKSSELLGECFHLSSKVWSSLFSWHCARCSSIIWNSWGLSESDSGVWNDKSSERYSRWSGPNMLFWWVVIGEWFNLQIPFSLHRGSVCSNIRLIPNDEANWASPEVCTGRLWQIEVK